MLNLEHPDLLANQAATKAIARGGSETLENIAIAAYMRVFDEKGREAAEETFFKHFNKGKDGASRTAMERAERRDA